MSFHCATLGHTLKKPFGAAPMARMFIGRRMPLYCDEQTITGTAESLH
jgi:hypothetical protein